MRQADAGFFLQQHELQMIVRSHPRGAVVQRIGFAPGAIDQIRQVADRAVGAHRDGIGIGGDQRDGGKLLHAVLRVPLDRDGDHVRHGGGEQRVPVRPCPRHRGEADLPASAGAVDHHDRAVQPCFQKASIGASHDIGAAAGGESHHHLDRPFRPAWLGDRRCRQGGGGSNAAEKRAAADGGGTEGDGCGHLLLLPGVGCGGSHPPGRPTPPPDQPFVTATEPPQPAPPRARPRGHAP